MKVQEGRNHVNSTTLPHTQKKNFAHMLQPKRK